MLNRRIENILMRAVIATGFACACTASAQPTGSNQASRSNPSNVGVGSVFETESASSTVAFEWIPATRAHASAAQTYRQIWEQDGERIIAALERNTCLPFVESEVAAVVDDGVSHSGGPRHPMRLRATYPREIKQATLVHELGHRHLWQLEKRLDDIDGHMTLDLVLDRVWRDVWGTQFADDRVATESAWHSEYDYAAAWAWAHSLQSGERKRLWGELLAMNGFSAECDPGSEPGSHFRPKQ